MSNFKQVREEIEQRLGNDQLLPCMICRKPTQPATLTNYGARCFRCYEAYCAEKPIIARRKAK